ncbi:MULTISPECIES: ribbon-helix-helix domain-containing protein [Paraburkholderia]|nr:MULTISPECIES: ribbon-helix-helix domain-containing protein [Paraburkholderia]MDR8402035.1 ribbon-helix-helix domain-containing protein [Paraburkholderia sp. USG1]
MDSSEHEKQPARLTSQMHGYLEMHQDIHCRNGGTPFPYSYTCKHMRMTRYCNFTPQLAKPRQRSVRINGLATCLRLEEVYWRIIEEIARQESVTVGKLISRWALEIDLTQEAICNFTGFVRIICVTQLLDRKHPIDLDLIDPDVSVGQLG